MGRWLILSQRPNTHRCATEILEEIQWLNRTSELQPRTSEGEECTFLHEGRTRRWHPMFQDLSKVPLKPHWGAQLMEKLQQPTAVCISPECSNSGWRVKDDLCSIHAVHEPVQRVMAPIADVHSNCSKLCLKHWVPCISFHIVSRLGKNKQF